MCRLRKLLELSALSLVALAFASPARAQLMPLRPYSGGICPDLVAGVDAGAPLNTEFVTGDDLREFRLIVPASYDGSTPWPVVTVWHFLLSSGPVSLSLMDVAKAASQLGFIAVVPESLKEPDGSRAYALDWPVAAAQLGAARREHLFLEDILACVDEQYNIDLGRVSAVGISAGALWVTALAGSEEAPRFSAVATLSGGLLYGMSYDPPETRFAALVVWSEPIDWFLADFRAASRRFRYALADDGQLVVTCVHNRGHLALPPFVPPPGASRLHQVFLFLTEHRKGEPSPYASGLPAVYPSWCATVAR